MVTEVVDVSKDFLKSLTTKSALENGLKGRRRPMLFATGVGPAAGHHQGSRVGGRAMIAVVFGKAIAALLHLRAIGSAPWVQFW